MRSNEGALEKKIYLGKVRGVSRLDWSHTARICAISVVEQSRVTCCNVLSPIGAPSCWGLLRLQAPTPSSAYAKYPSSDCTTTNRPNTLGSIPHTAATMSQVHAMSDDQVCSLYRGRGRSIAPHQLRQQCTEAPANHTHHGRSPAS